MIVTGLITEYNPFHNGHLYHIEQARAMTGADYIIVIMSGNFLQRGTPAIIDKYSRAQMALLCGADLVLELPCLYAVSSAEYFAAGAVEILNRLGIVNYLVFGSEIDNIDRLHEIANLLIDEPDEYKLLLKKYLKSGLSYASARERAISEYTKDIHIADILSSPNNILGIEYIKALKRTSSAIQPMCLKRKESMYHDASITSCIASATAIRNELQASGINSDSLKLSVPTDVYDILSSSYEKTFPIYASDMSPILNYRLLSETKENLSLYYDVNNGLEDRIMNNIINYDDITQFSNLLKTKQLAMSRISRVLTHILLDIKSDFFKKHSASMTSYARVLGFKRSCSCLLRDIKVNNQISVVTKAADAVNILSADEYELFKKDIYASDVYGVLVKAKYHTSVKNDYIQNIKMV